MPSHSPYTTLEILSFVTCSTVRYSRHSLTSFGAGGPGGYGPRPPRGQGGNGYGQQGYGPPGYGPPGYQPGPPPGQGQGQGQHQAEGAQFGDHEAAPVLASATGFAGAAWAGAEPSPFCHSPDFLSASTTSLGM